MIQLFMTENDRDTEANVEPEDIQVEKSYFWEKASAEWDIVQVAIGDCRKYSKVTKIMSFPF